MTSEQKAAFVFAQGVAALAEIEGMKAANREAYSRPTKPRRAPFSKGDFDAVIEKYGLGYNTVTGILS